MNALRLLASQLWVERLGWTLVHFLWEGVLIGALYAAARWTWRSANPRTRYLLACVALAGMMAAPLLTLTLMHPADVVETPSGLPGPVRVVASPVATILPQLARDTISGAGSEELLTWVVVAWFVGTIAFWVRLTGGWLLTVRMRSSRSRPAQPEWQQTLGRLGARMGVPRPARLLVSAVVQVPAVVGWLRPAVLMPIGALAGLPREHVEALLVHELAHIRRHDYLVNILQGVAEALLFYHPAVWWVSGHIRTEREMCCDDIAVKVSGDVLTYARALAELESFRPAHLPVAVAATGGSLESRIGRLLNQSLPVSRTLSGPGVLVSAFLIVASACVVFGQSAASLQFESALIALNSSQATDTVALNGVRNPGFVNMHTGGRLTAAWAVPRSLIREAYGYKPFQVLGGPDWIDSEHYDIEAKAAGNPGSNQMLLMLRSLLADRFTLKVHRETRELPVYVLTAANSGLKIQPARAGSCLMPDTPPMARFTMPQPPWQSIPPCGRAQVSLMSLSEAWLVAGSISMAELTDDLSNILGRRVIDRTRFGGTFDIQVQFAPDEALAGIRSDGYQALPPELAWASISAGMEKQLGLKIESSTAPVEVLVIDGIERPIEN